MLDGLLVSLSPFLFEDLEHRALCMLEHSCSYMDGESSAYRILSRSEFVYRVEMKRVAGPDIFQTRDGKDVTRSEQVFSTGNRSDGIVRRLGLY